MAKVFFDALIYHTRGNVLCFVKDMHNVYCIPVYAALPLFTPPKGESCLDKVA